MADEVSQREGARSVGPLDLLARYAGDDAVGSLADPLEVGHKRFCALYIHWNSLTISEVVDAYL